MPSIFELFKKHTILWAEGSTLIYKMILSQTKHPYKFLVLCFGQSCLPLELRQLLELRRPALTLHFALLSGTLVLSNFWIHLGCKNWRHAHSPEWIIFFLFYPFTLGLEGKRKKCKNSSNTGFSALALLKIGAKWSFFVELLCTPRDMAQSSDLHLPSVSFTPPPYWTPRNVSRAWD